MRLKQIDIMGFKSFADKVVFSLSEGITAIVGPNGSGKSNVADAVRWVLGEQSARALRGTKMEDVIFNGTTTRKPISLCEVALLFDNSDGTLPIETTDIAVTRKLFRNGESEYLINNQIVRMRDIQALFYDTGVGREGYSIIGQGRIEEILSAKGEERREALEEAAGVMKYKIRREDARRKLASVASDIVRIEDILTELEQSLEPLREQKEKAAVALTLENRLKTLDINLFINQYDRNRSRFLSLSNEMQSFEQEENAHKKSISTSQQDLSGIDVKFSLIEELLERAREKKSEIVTQLQRLQGQSDLTQQKLDFLKQEQLRLQEQCESLQVQYTTLQTRMEQGDAISQDHLSALEQTVAELSAKLESANGEINQLEEHLDENKQKLLQQIDGDAQRKARIARMEALKSQAGEREAEIESRLMQANTELQQIELEMEQTSEQVNLYKSLESEAQKLLLLYGQTQDNAQKDLEQARQTLLASQGECQRRENALRTQKQLLADFEGYNNSIRHLMRDIQGKSLDGTGVVGTVAGLLKVPKDLETAIEQVLGGALQNLVVDTQQTAKRLIDYLRNRQYGRVTFLPQQSLRLNLFSSSEKSQLTGQGILGIASELVQFDTNAQKSIQYLLGRTVIAQDIDAGIELTNRCTFSFRCVTLKGDILQSGGAMTGGSVREFNLVSRERLVKEAEEALVTAQSAHNITQERYAQSQKDVEIAINAYAQQREVLYEKQADVRSMLEKHDVTNYAMQKAVALCGQLETEAQRIRTMRSDVQREMEQIENSQPSDEQELRRIIDTDTVLLSELRINRDGIGDTLAQQRELLAVSRTQKRNNDMLLMDARKESQKVQQGIELTQAQQSDNTSAQDEANEELIQIQCSVDDILQAQEENESALLAVQAQHEAYTHQRSALTQSIENHRTAMMEQQERKFRVETQLQRLESDFEHMQERLWDTYELTYAQAQALKEDINLQNAAKEAEEIREQIREMGEVYRGAIEEYQRVETRFVYLRTQKEDLQRAQGDLESLIKDLTAQMQKQFLEQFDFINGHFNRIFKTLFGGGRAELVLSDPRQAMECTIDIIAQPPGKNLQLITLLSGGERALTAIALLFALLEVRATPFCILDEIEAALDEENLRLFAEFLKAYAKSTQFVVITHRRPTMEAASYMYGIAMEEAGVSKTVSVRFA